MVSSPKYVEVAHLPQVKKKFTLPILYECDSSANKTVSNYDANVLVAVDDYVKPVEGEEILDFGSYVKNKRQSKMIRPDCQTFG